MSDGSGKIGGIIALEFWCVYFLLFQRKLRLEINETKSMEHHPCPVLHFGVCGLFDCLIGMNKFTMELTAGDTLEIQFTATKGSMQMEIKEPDGDTLYAGNGKGVSDFTVNISESGTYSIYVKVHHAKGTVYIQQKGEKKDAR